MEICLVDDDILENTSNTPHTGMIQLKVGVCMVQKMSDILFGDQTGDQRLLSCVASFRPGLMACHSERMGEDATVS